MGDFMKTFLNILIGTQLVAGVAWAEPALKVKRAGRAPASNLKMKSSQVPTFEVYQKSNAKGQTETRKVTTIPALDIGSEREVSASSLAPLSLEKIPDVKLNGIQRRPSPEVVKLPVTPYNVVVGNPKMVTTSEAFNKIPDVKPLGDVRSPVTKETNPQPVKIEEIQANDYKLLQALIFLEVQKNYELAMALFAELMEDKEHRIEALYQYALTAKGMNLPSEFRQYMIKVAQETKSKEWQERAANSLVANITDLKMSDIGMIDPLVNKYEIDVTKNQDYQITRAKYYSEQGQLGLMEDALMYIDEKSPKYPESLLLSALFNYRQGKVDEAVIYLDKLMALTDGDKAAPLRSIGALTLARIQFQKSQYKDAFQSYLKVDKSNPLWLQAMVEQAWTQILSEDYEGAAGNMFSLHTDFFKQAFSPESYVVRTVGYLNLCQYGDGAQVLQEMQKRYTPWKGKLDAYSTSHKQTTAYYDTVKTWLKNSDLKEVDGLPRSFIVELARHPSFMTVQKQINGYEDETQRFNKIALTLIKLERSMIQKQSEASKEMADAKRSGSSDKVATAERKLLGAKIQYHIAKKARLSIKSLRDSGLARIEKEKNGMRDVASSALQRRFKEMQANLNRVIDQNEVLKYELFSGAGEHIRYQMAGGEVNDKERAELKVADEKQLNWKFKGEIWEDEVGHYRSSLKNVCPQDQNALAGMNE
jgi:Putative Zn-dependent protease, contains TPR repeats